MTLKPAALAAALILAPLALAQEPSVLAHANGIRVEDGYARAAAPTAPTGAAYMRLTNETDADDRLLEVRTEAADRAELHAHEMQDGIARMRERMARDPLVAARASRARVVDQFSTARLVGHSERVLEEVHRRHCTLGGVTP